MLFTIQSSGLYRLSRYRLSSRTRNYPTSIFVGPHLLGQRELKILLKEKLASYNILVEYVYIHTKIYTHISNTYIYIYIYTHKTIF